MEIWKEIPGYEGLYEASSYGLIKSVKNGRNKVLSISKNDLYDRVTLNNKNKKSFYVHRLIAQTFIKNHKPGLLEVNHINANKKDNKVSNLEWITRRENIRHSVRMNTKGHKSNLGKSTLTVELQEKIFSMKHRGVKQKTIALLIGAHPATVSRILNNKILPYNETV